MKKIKKIFSILIITFLLCNIFGTVYGGNITINPDSYKPSNLSESQSTIDLANTLIGGIQAIGSIASVLALVLIGIKYMVGSTEEKAEFKETAIYYIIGAIFVFAISNISAVIYNAVK